MNRILSLKLLLVAMACGIVSSGSAEDIDFENDIFPILDNNCLHCHGEDESESGLRLDRRVFMLRGGDSGLASVIPGHPENSYLIEAVNHAEADIAMPPDEDKLPAEEIELLTRWIQEGAVWPGQMDDVVTEDTEHWSFLPVVRPEVPEVVGGDEDHAIDAFLRKRLAQEGLDFSAPADPRSLIRRTSIILTGLAPTPERTEAFVTACQADGDAAYEQLVDELLASQHFGERWAQHWLDVIRWAETNGSEANLYRKNAWIYRDYVVRAFNEDKPYDQFVREQIAGDSMGVGEATGFLVAGPHVPAATVGREPSAIRQARADRLDEVMQTVGASVMGVTVGCARCHNHKFDPISIKDYYSLTAVFQDIEFGSRFPEFADEHPRRQRGKEVRQEISKYRKQLSAIGGWEEDWGAYREIHFKPITTRAIRVRFKTPNVGLDELEVFGSESSRKNLALPKNGATLTGFPEDGFEGRYPIDRLNDREFGTMNWRVELPKDTDELPWVKIAFDSPQEVARMRLSSNREYFYDTDYLDKKPHLPRYQYDMDIMDEAGNWKPWTGTWVTTTKLAKDHPERKAILDEVQKWINTLAEDGPQPSFVGRFVEPDVTHVLLRGSPETPRDEVPPAGPAIFSGDLGLDSSASGAQRRAEFAKWVTSTDNPLTSRVMVNRIWHHIFGTGIVPTTSDFGLAGAPPTHPQLLDWLASEFVDAKDANPWSMKSMIRLMVMSDAFRQSSAPNTEAVRIDASSMLLWRFPPRRVEAEVIRDSVLLATGALDPAIGGRSYRIHNEKQTYAQWEVLDNHGPKTWRRMLYQERMRRVDDRIFTAFDFPDCGQVRAKRPVSTTPLQALNLMNSDFVVEQSVLLAKRARNEAGDSLPKQVARCFELLLDRQPGDDEIETAIEFSESQSLELLCRTLINTNEFAFLP
ncbi:Planctomycete cytochrome C [Rubripirellula tenax]|uniref:Planctomycete cytochrome C n=1 Tax=Rubripirellula tenax TaxID=2528015 RepID=A0A5C6F623_9BACT|nr:PSD1 and planctomycete cytochrome C domain-containing protein [Rubripirellula tenax]TWU56685.1 Planctomycete cytochrome C [Rubripirellula tenax]